MNENYIISEGGCKMTDSKAWKWKEKTGVCWLTLSEKSYYISIVVVKLRSKGKGEEAYGNCLGELF
jgi:hypothetical protein